MPRRMALYVREVTDEEVFLLLEMLMAPSDEPVRIRRCGDVLRTAEERKLVSKTGRGPNGVQVTKAGRNYYWRKNPMSKRMVLIQSNKKENEL